MTNFVLKSMLIGASSIEPRASRIALATSRPRPPYPRHVGRAPEHDDHAHELGQEEEEHGQREEGQRLRHRDGVPEERGRVVGRRERRVAARSSN